MRIQFVLRHAGTLRILDSTLRALASAGHDVHLIYNIKEGRVGDELTELLRADFPHISYEYAPRPAGTWSFFAMLCGVSIDWLRYKDPRYGDARKLAERADHRIARAGQNLRVTLETLSSILGWKRAIRLLQALLRATPPASAVTAFLSDRPADVVIFSPLVDFGSEQAEFVSAARRLGRKTMLLVHSWDNLTNKGLMRVIPDQVLVWNEAQRAEAIDMHDARPDQVVVTGAQCYDLWYEMSATDERETFCRRAGLDPARPYVLYTGSSPFIGANEETDLVLELRNALDESALRHVQILVRPHPQNAATWNDIRDRDGLGVYPRGGALPVKVSARGDYFDSIHHSIAVVGVNTSAMIEASIIGRPVCSLLDERFRETQQGTLHFHHLLSSGHMLTAQGPQELIAKLGEILAGTLDYGTRTQAFLEAFIRPAGSSVAATPAVVDAIEALASRPEQNDRRTLGEWLAGGPVRLLYPAMWLALRYSPAMKGIMPKKKKKKKKKRIAR